MMNMESRNQYLKELREEYLQTKSKKERGRVLDEAEKRTGLNRKYLMEKLRPKSNLDTNKEQRKKRRAIYDGPVKAALATCWKIFDFPCEQRLGPLLKTEIEKLRKLGEIACSDEVTAKLKKISFRTIDEKLKHTKEVEHQKRKYHYWLVGRRSSHGKGTRAHISGHAERERPLSLLLERDALRQWNRVHQLASVPLHKERRTGILQVSSLQEERQYRNELRLFKNFFQPVMKLALKERVGGKIRRRYDTPRTPYQRVMESKEVSAEAKKDLKEIYDTLNPAELKRAIDKKLDNLYEAYQKKNRSQKVEPKKKQAPRSVRFFIAQPEPLSVR